MHYDKSLFANYHYLKHRLYVGGIRSGLKAVGVGDVEIRDSDGKSRILKSVLHVPVLKCGLMSLNTLTLVGLNSTFTKDGSVVTDGDFRIHGPIKNRLCIWSEEGISGENSSINGLFASIALKKVSLMDWYERLGHVSKNTVLKFGEAIEDLDIDLEDRENEHQTPYESCTYGKYTCSPFKPHTER